MISGLTTILENLFYSDPAVLYVSIIDADGMELTSMKKTYYAKTKAKDYIGPLVNSIMNYCDRFLKYLQGNSTSPFVFSWIFEQLYVFATYSQYGTIVVYSETDVNDGLVKILLQRAIVRYGTLMHPVFDV